jgi:hypothetical protein
VHACGQHRAGQARHADQHHLYEEVPLLHREVFQRRDMLQPGVVDQHFDRTRDVLQRLGDAVVGRDVQAPAFGRAAIVADRGRDGFGRLEVDVRNDKMMAGSGQFRGDPGADAAAGAG